jgi:hypothetical protein
MSGPVRSSPACSSSSPRGGMLNTCGRTAILFSQSEKPGFGCPWRTLNLKEE